MANIFDVLKEEGIPYAVIVFFERMKIKSFDNSSKGYYIAALKKHKKKLLAFKFKQSSELSRTIIEYDLSEDEENYFRNRADRDYTKILHNEQGRVYNLKGVNFKNHHDAFREEIGA